MGPSAVNNFSTIASSTGAPLFMACRQVAGSCHDSVRIPSKKTKASHKLAIYKAIARPRKQISKFHKVKLKDLSSAAVTGGIHDQL